MHSKEICRLITTILCITTVLTLVQCAASEPLLASSRLNEDDSADSSIWARPSSDSESSGLGSENEASRPKFFPIDSEHYYNRLSQPRPSEPVRRANFWKRANFWRKRANFW